MLLQQIGEGGFGDVYMAEQEKPVRRMVALKIIKLGMDTAQVIARFETERQALAIMAHPNVAMVLDAGTAESRRPYFVMDPLPEKQRDQHRQASVRRSEMLSDLSRAISRFAEISCFDGGVVIHEFSA